MNPSPFSFVCNIARSSVPSMRRSAAPIAPVKPDFNARRDSTLRLNVSGRACRPASTARRHALTSSSSSPSPLPSLPSSSLPDASRRFQTLSFIRMFMRFIRADAGSGVTGSMWKALFAHTSPSPSIAATVAIALATASAGVHHSLHRSPIRMSEVHPPAHVANASAIVPSPSHPHPSKERGPMFPGRYTHTGTPHDFAVAHTSISVTHLACAYPCHVPPCTSAVSYPPAAASDASASPPAVADSDQDSSATSAAGVPSGGRTALDDTWCTAIAPDRRHASRSASRAGATLPDAMDA
mmetsp:Transcript_725/g.3313  ORF Transcript_725/g.3313 Transcript_725/m.3313 type:complete len:297 (-) Transcript_725:1202-2092(-)